MYMTTKLHAQPPVSCKNETFVSNFQPPCWLVHGTMNSLRLAITKTNGEDENSRQTFHFYNSPAVDCCVQFCCCVHLVPRADLFLICPFWTSLGTTAGSTTT